MQSKLNIMVLAGGPDRERPVSLMSGGTVTESLKSLGHNVVQRDILPTDLSALDEFAAWPGDVIFPMLHGSWGEGGALQTILESRNLPYVGCRAGAASLCMNKTRTKDTLVKSGLPTPRYQSFKAGDRLDFGPPMVIKAPCEGSSIDLFICKTQDQVDKARAELEPRHTDLLAEQFIKGKEITIGVIDIGAGFQALPPIHIIPATDFYDYEAKYTRDDTQYLFDIDVPAPILSQMQDITVRVARSLGLRHMSRVDFIVDEQNRPWILEVNTIPGHTSHSLLPKAARQAGIPLEVMLNHFAQNASGKSARAAG